MRMQRKSLYHFYTKGTSLELIIILDASHALLETTYPFTQTFHELRNFPATKEQQDNQYDEDYFLSSYPKHHYLRIRYLTNR